MGVGIFGFIAYMCMLGSVFREFVRGIRAKWKPQDRHMSDLAYYLCVMYCATLIGVLFLSLPFYYVVWLPAAAGLVVGRLARRAERGENLVET